MAASEIFLVLDPEHVGSISVRQLLVAFGLPPALRRAPARYREGGARARRVRRCTELGRCRSVGEVEAAVFDAWGGSFDL